MHPEREGKKKKTLIIRATVHKSCAYLHKPRPWAAGRFFNLFFCCCREEKGHSKHKGGRGAEGRLKGRATRDPWTRRFQGAKERRDLWPPTRGGRLQLASHQNGCQGLKRGAEAATGEGRSHARVAVRTRMTDLALALIAMPGESS